MQHLEINPYTPGQVCIDINSKNSEKSIMKNLFNYFNKKQQKMNNSFNKIINSQNVANREQRFTIYAPMLEGLTTSKREAISSVDCQSRKNFIQQNKNFVVKKTRPMTTNPSNRQNQQQLISKPNCKKLPNIDVGVGKSNNPSQIYSQVNEQYNPLNSSNIRSDGLSQNSKEFANIEQNFQKSPNVVQEQQRLSKISIKKSLVNSIIGQGLNKSFDGFQSRKNSLNRKILYCNNNNNNQTLQTQGLLETQADTTIQQPCDQGKQTYSQTINSNLDQVQFTQMMNQTTIDQQQTLDQQRQIKTLSENYKTEESEARITNKYKNINDLEQQTNHFCSKSTHFQHSMSTQNNENFTNQKNDGTTIDTLLHQNLTQGDEINLNTSNNNGIEKINDILQQQYQQSIQNELSTDQQVVDASQINLLNERPPFNKKTKLKRNKMRSSSSLAEGGQISKELSKNNNNHNLSFNQTLEQQKDETKSQRSRKHSNQSTQNSTNRVNHNKQSQNILINQQDIGTGRMLLQEKSEIYTFNNNIFSERIDEFLSNQQTERESQANKEIIPIRNEYLDTLQKEKIEKDGKFQVTIEEDIENIITIEENEREIVNNLEIKQNKNGEGIPNTVRQSQKIQELQKENYQQFEREQNINVDQIEKSVKTPQKELNTNVSSLQNSLQKLQMRSNHITFNVMSNTKDYFDQQASLLQKNLSFVGIQQVSDQKYITSSFDGRNQTFGESQIDQEIRASRHFNEMKEIIQNQIDSNKQVINQYHEANQSQSSMRMLKQENQLSNPTQQVIEQGNSNSQTQLNQNCSLQQAQNRQVIQQGLSRPVSAKIPLTGVKKVNIEKKFNFYDELDKKLEEKKKNITNFLETNRIDSFVQQSIPNNSEGNKQIAQISNRNFYSGRNNSLQINSNQQTHRQPLSLRRKSTKDTSHFNANNLVLNESKMYNYNVVSDLRENPQKFNNQMFVLTENNLIEKNGIDQKKDDEIQRQYINNHCIKPIQQQIYYQQFLQNHPTKDNILNLQQQQLIINNSQKQENQLHVINNLNKISKSQRPPSNYYNNIRQQQQQQYNNPKTQQNLLLQNNQLQTQSFSQKPQVSSHNESQDFGYNIPSHSRITRKKRASTIENTYQTQQGKEINYVQAHSSERQSLQNSSRNVNSHAQLTKEEQIEIIKKVQEQSQNKQKLHSYLQQNQVLHEQMKITESMQRNSSSISHQIQNQINSTLQNCSSNNLGIMYNTQQTSQMNLNTQPHSTQKKSINPLASLLNTQDFLQSMKLVNNNTQQSYGEDLNTSLQLLNNKRFYSAQSSAHRQNPLLQSDQSQLISNVIKPFNSTVGDLSQNTKILAGELDITQQYINPLQQQQYPFPQNKKLNLTSIPQPTEEDTSFSRRRKSVNPLYKLTEQQLALKSSIELNSNNVQFYDNLNNNSIKQDLDIDQRVYANHQYQYALKRQSRKEDAQILHQQMDNHNQQNNNLNNTNQLKQRLQQQSLLNEEQFISKNQQNTFGLEKNVQNSKKPLSSQRQIVSDHQHHHHGHQQFNSKQNTNKFNRASHKDKENIPILQNYQNLDGYILQNIEGCSSKLRGRQTNSKTSNRYNIQFSEDVDDKTLEYSGSKAGGDNYY